MTSLESDPNSQALVRKSTTRPTKKSKIKQANSSIPRSNSDSEGVLKPSILSYFSKQ